MEDISEPDPQDLDPKSLERVRIGIQRIRKVRALSLEQLSAKVGLSQPFTCRLLTGNRKMSSFMQRGSARLSKCRFPL